MVVYDSKAEDGLAGRVPQSKGPGKVPAGVREGKTVLIGTLSYFRISAALCSLCVKKMESAVASRPWFVKAHAEHSGPNHKRNGPEPDGAVLGNSTLATLTARKLS